MLVSGIISRHTLQECQEIFRDIYVRVWNYFQHTCQYLELFPDIYVSVWNYFQTYIAAVSGIICWHTWQQCLEIFPEIFVSVWKYFQINTSVPGISRHICKCLELFPEKYVWKYFQTCQCFELFPDIYVSVWNYFQTYMSVSGNISRHIWDTYLEFYGSNSILLSMSYILS